MRHKLKMSFHNHDEEIIRRLNSRRGDKLDKKAVCTKDEKVKDAILKAKWPKEGMTKGEKLKFLENLTDDLMDGED